METVIHQTFRYIGHRDACGFTKTAAVKDTLVSDHSIFSAIEYRIIVVQSFRDVVGIQDSYFGGASQVRSTHKLQVGPGDGQDSGRTPWRGCHWARIRVAVLEKEMTREKVTQMLCHGDRADARASTTVRNTEGLV